MDHSEAPNRDQIDYWNSPTAKKWVAFEESIDQVFGSVSRRLLERAVPRPGEAVLDVGCGGGATTMAIARQVGEQGRVLGIDVSEALLTRAEERRVAAGLGQIDYLLADAQTHGFEPERFDLAGLPFRGDVLWRPGRRLCEHGAPGFARAGAWPLPAGRRCR